MEPVRVIQGRKATATKRNREQRNRESMILLISSPNVTADVEWSVVLGVQNEVLQHPREADLLLQHLKAVRSLTVPYETSSRKCEEE